MKDKETDYLKPLLAEWTQVPEPQAGTAQRVMRACRQGHGSRARAGFRMALACLAFGAVTGVVYAEWVSLRRDALVDSAMANRYLSSIDPDFGSGGESPKVP